MAKDAPKDQYNVLEAKTHLSRLLAEVEAGREITIARNGTAIAKVVPIRQKRPIDAFGCLRGVYPPHEDDGSGEDFEILEMFGLLTDEELAKRRQA